MSSPKPGRPYGHAVPEHPGELILACFFRVSGEVWNVMAPMRDAFGRHLDGQYQVVESFESSTAAVEYIQKMASFAASSTRGKN